MMEGHPKESLMAGVNYSVFERVKPYILRFKSNLIIFTGGVAKNKAIAEIIRREIGREVIVPDEPQANGAIGCAYYAKKINMRSQNRIS